MIISEICATDAIPSLVSRAQQPNTRYSRRRRLMLLICSLVYNPRSLLVNTRIQKIGIPPLQTDLSVKGSYELIVLIVPRHLREYRDMQLINGITHSTSHGCSCCRADQLSITNARGVNLSNIGKPVGSRT